jgi:hypothetical protein
LKESKHIVVDDDGSKGTQVVPISMLYEVNCEKVPFFYTLICVVYPKWCNPIKGPSLGCNYVGKCSNSVKYFSVVKNEGKKSF